MTLYANNLVLASVILLASSKANLNFPNQIKISPIRLYPSGRVGSGRPIKYSPVLLSQSIFLGRWYLSLSLSLSPCPVPSGQETSFCVGLTERESFESISACLSGLPNERETRSLQFVKFWILVFYFFSDDEMNAMQSGKRFLKDSILFCVSVCVCVFFFMSGLF